MSKYEELQQALSEGNKEYLDYRTSCAQAIGEFRECLIEYLQCPDNAVWFYDGEVSKELTPLDGLDFRHDAIGHIDMALRLTQNRVACISLGIQKEGDGSFMIGIDTDGNNVFEIHNPTHYKHCFDHLFTYLHDAYKTRLNIYLKTGKQRAEQKQEE